MHSDDNSAGLLSRRLTTCEFGDGNRVFGIFEFRIHFKLRLLEEQLLVGSFCDWPQFCFKEQKGQTCEVIKSPCETCAFLGLVCGKRSFRNLKGFVTGELLVDLFCECRSCFVVRGFV